jgi:hypothetical protein
MQQLQEAVVIFTLHLAYLLNKFGANPHKTHYIKVDA